MQGKGHAIAHLTRLRHRRQDLDATNVFGEGGIAAVLVEQRARFIERGGAGIDQR